MALIIKEIKLEVSKPNLIQAIVAKQNDCNSRFLKASLWDEGVQLPINPLSEVTINAERKDGASDSFFGEVNDDNTVTVPLHSWMLELDGTVNCDVSILVDGRRLTTTSFVVMVEKASNNSDNISNDPQYNVLADLIQQVGGLSGNNSVNAIKSASVNSSGRLVITLNDGTKIDAGLVKGKDGKDGKDGVVDYSLVAAPLKNKKVGNPIVLDDISPFEHEIKVSVTSKESELLVSGEFGNGNFEEEGLYTILGFEEFEEYGEKYCKITFKEGKYYDVGVTYYDDGFESADAFINRLGLKVGDIVFAKFEILEDFSEWYSLYSYEVPTTVNKFEKNLVPYPHYKEVGEKVTSNGVTFVDNGDNTVTANGKASGGMGGYSIFNKKLDVPMPVGKYVFYGLDEINVTRNTLYSEPIFSQLVLYDENGGKYKSIECNGNNKVIRFTLDKPVGKIVLYVRIKDGVTVENQKFYSLLVKEDNMTSHEVDANGNVNEIVGNGEDMTLIADNGATISAEYNADTKKYIDKKFAELAAMLVNE